MTRHRLVPQQGCQEGWRMCGRTLTMRCWWESSHICWLRCINDDFAQYLQSTLGPGEGHEGTQWGAGKRMKPLWAFNSSGALEIVYFSISMARGYARPPPARFFFRGRNKSTPVATSGSLGGPWGCWLPLGSNGTAVRSREGRRSMAGRDAVSRRNQGWSCQTRWAKRLKTPN